MNPRTILITGAAGNMGGKLRRHLEGSCPLRLLDRAPQGDPAIEPVDLDRWDHAWVERFRGVDTVVHLAADPLAQQVWPKLLGPNVDALINVYQACIAAGVPRLVYASSNHVMAGYKDDPHVPLLSPDLPPRPGVRYVVNGEVRDSGPYASAKLFGERLGLVYSSIHSLSVIAVRVGWVRSGVNRPQDIPSDREDWFRLMWLSNRDYCHLMECCIEAPSSLRFAIVNGMSANTGMRWDLEPTRRLLGYEPIHDVTKPFEDR